MITKEASKWLRGIAILMVVASHYAEWIGAGNLEPLREFISRLGDYGVDIFFLMSGYGLAKAAGSKKISLEFVWKRAVSAYLPYLLIIGGLEIYDGYFFTKILAKENYLWKFLVGYDYWFMMNLFVFYLLFFFCWNYKYIRTLVLGAGIFLYSNHLFELGNMEFWYVSNLAFVVGALYAELEPLFKKLLDKYLSQKTVLKECMFKLGGVAIMIGCFYYGNRVFLLPDEAGTLVKLHLVFSVGTALFASGTWFKGFLVPIIGSYSLYIYLLHVRLFHLMYWGLEDMSTFAKLARVSLITLVICIAVGFVCQDVLLKPFVRKKKRIAKNSTSAE